MDEEKVMATNEAQKWPTNKDQYDLNWLTAMGYCNRKECSRATFCYRFQERIGKNNRTYVPVEDTETCQWFVSDGCWQCRGKGFYSDYDHVLKKKIQTKCLLCGGKNDSLDN